MGGLVRRHRCPEQSRWRYQIGLASPRPIGVRYTGTLAHTCHLTPRAGIHGKFDTFGLSRAGPDKPDVGGT